MFSKNVFHFCLKLEGEGRGEVVYSSQTLPVMDVFEVTRDAVALT